MLSPGGSTVLLSTLGLPGFSCSECLWWHIQLRTLFSVLALAVFLVVVNISVHSVLEWAAHKFGLQPGSGGGHWILNPHCWILHTGVHHPTPPSPLAEGAHLRGCFSSPAAGLLCSGVALPFRESRTSAALQALQGVSWGMPRAAWAFITWGQMCLRTQSCPLGLFQPGSYQVSAFAILCDGTWRDAAPKHTQAPSSWREGMAAAS